MREVVPVSRDGVWLVGHDFKVKWLNFIVRHQVIERRRRLGVHFLFETQNIDIILDRELAKLDLYISVSHISKKGKFDMSFI